MNDGMINTSGYPPLSRGSSQNCASCSSQTKTVCMPRPDDTAESESKLALTNVEAMRFNWFAFDHTLMTCSSAILAHDVG